MHIQAVSRRRIAGFVGTVAATLALTISGALPAAAHTALSSSDPEAGATLESAPAKVTLRFTDDVSTVGATVRVEGPGGVATAGTPSVAGATVTQPLAGGLAGGRYLVRWQVAAGDGHPITGKFSFSLSAPAPTTAPTPSAEPRASEPPEPSSTATELTSAGDEDGGEDGGGGSQIAIWVAVAVAVSAGLGSTVARRRKQEPTNADPTDDAPRL